MTAVRVVMAAFLAAALLAVHAAVVVASPMVQTVRMAPLVLAADSGSNATNTTNAPTVPVGTSQRCDAQLLFQKLYVLMPAINQCATESDYFITPANLSMPSDASLAKYCGSKNCSLLSQELDNAGLPSCTVPVGNTTMSFKLFFKNVKDHCDTTSKSSSSTPSAPSNSAGLTGYNPPVLARFALGAVVLTVLTSV